LKVTSICGTLAPLISNSENQMSEEKVPATEANEVVDVDERQSYELAFHVLPTVAEGEVAQVFQSIKDLVTKNGGEIFDEEEAKRFDLAYEIVKHLEGKNRRFSSAYFGWVRFKAESGAVQALTEEVDGRSDILRSLLIRLTKAEEAHPFRFHEALGKSRVETVAVEESDKKLELKTENEEEAEVDAEEIDEALEKSEA
tara:strand:+ start:599 stop:1195 length:597 start_codon:yes stop_codon:yes gene_type:complete